MNNTTSAYSTNFITQSPHCPDCGKCKTCGQPKTPQVTQPTITWTNHPSYTFTKAAEFID